MPDPALSYLLELRLRTRGNPEARALVDRCLALLAQAESADPETLEALHREVQKIGDGLALRFGAPKSAALQ